MSEKYILSIDCGTQSLRAAIFDKEGTLLGKEQLKFKAYESLNPGWAEQDVMVYWNSLCKACQSLKEREPEKWSKIDALIVTTLRDTAVCIDEGGNPLRPAIVWLDQRRVKIKEKLRMWDNLQFSLVGMKRTVYLTRAYAKANWIKINQPEIWNKTYKYLLISGFLNYKLSGEIVDSVASQVAHMPFDYKKKKWEASPNSWKWSVFGVEKDKLYDLVQPTKPMGSVSAIAAEATGIREGTPLIAGGSDKASETIGVGCIDANAASISFGTTATIEITSPRYFEPIRFMPAFPALVPGHFNPEVEVFRGYWMISWFRREFAAKEEVEARKLGINPEELLNRRLSEIPPGSQGLILQPYWGPHIKTPDAKGSIIGFGEIHTRIHIYRAIIEGINYALMDGLEMIEKKSENRIEKIMVSGGGSQSDAICQITADMFNRPVYKSQTSENSSLGAAMTGFVGNGTYSNFREAVEHMVHYKNIYQPNSENAEIYRKLYRRVYRSIYSRLKRLYREIKYITHYPAD